jgi:signal transduction histidine kinase
VTRSVRARLTLWYAAALAVVMIAYGAFVYVTQRASLSADFEHQLDEDHESVEETLKRAGDGGTDWRAELARLWPTDDGYDRRVEVRREDGSLLFASAPAEAMAEARGSEPHEYRLDGVPATVTFLRPATRMEHELNQLLLVLALGVPLGVGLAALGGYALARRALAPVGKMADRARTISASNLAERLPVENPDDEFGRLATVFNDTLARLEGSFEQLRRFTADASHELRTPLTAIRAVGEVGLREPRTPEEYREVVGSMLEEVDRLAQLVESLLTLSRADAGRIALRPETIDLTALAREVVGHLSVLAEEKRQTIEVEAK